MGGLDSSLETMRWLNTLLKCSIRKSFVIKSFANNNNDSKINKMLYSVRVINGKERFRFYIFYCLRN